MLFDPERHEVLRGSAWDASRARDAIRAIIYDIEEGRVADGHWKGHPLDDEDGDEPQTGFKSLYVGSAGILWALWYLQREGAVDLLSDPTIGIQRAVAAYLVEPDTGEVVPSYFLGEVGILLVLWLLTGTFKAGSRT